MIEVAAESTAKALMVRSVKPELVGDQITPPLVLLKTPPPELPVKITLGSDGSIANDNSVALVKPELMAVQLPAPFVLLTIPPLPTRTTPGVVGKLTEADEPVRNNSPEAARSRPKPPSSP